ncbi:MAG: peptidylprolyl isomerase [Bryobacterales bacterium]|nr:peptidylprolyl isomerase [Bryobacterales bacterium]
MRFFSGCALLLLTSALFAGEPVVIEQIVAKVNADIITLGDLDESREMLTQELAAQCRNDKNCINEQMEKRKNDVLRDQIDQTLLVQKAKDLNINVDSQVSRQMAEMQVKVGIKDPEEFRQFIQTQTGMPIEDYREKMKQGLLQQEVIGQEVSSKIVIPRSEVEKYYEDHKNEFYRDKESVGLQEILIGKKTKDGLERTEAELKEKADEIYQKAKSGGKFNELAIENSDAMSAPEGGNLGYLAKGELNPEIEKIVFSAEKGFVTPPIQVPNGFLILRVADKVSPGLQPLPVVENEIMNRLFSPRFQPAIRTYLTKLRTDAFLEIREGFHDSGEVPGKDTSWKDPAELKPETISKEQVAQQTRRKRLLWMIPIPGTTTAQKSSN